jgi:hypothetical protein
MGTISGQVQEHGFPLKFAHKQQFPAILGGKDLEGVLFALEPVHAEAEAVCGGEDGKPARLFLEEGNQQVNGELDRAGGGLLRVNFPFPDFKFFLEPPGQPIHRDEGKIFEQNRPRWRAAWPAAGLFAAQRRQGHFAADKGQLALEGNFHGAQVVAGHEADAAEHAFVGAHHFEDLAGAAFVPGVDEEAGHPV